MVGGASGGGRSLVLPGRGAMSWADPSELGAVVLRPQDHPSPACVPVDAERCGQALRLQETGTRSGPVLPDVHRVRLPRETRPRALGATLIFLLP